jgi:exonuclease SbcC
LARLQDVVAALAAELQGYSGLDEDMAAVKGEAKRTQPAYEAVLANRRLAGTVEDRVADAAARTADLEQAQREGAEVAAQLVDAEGRYDEAAYQRSVQCEQELRGTLGELRARLELLARDQAQDQADLETLAAMRATVAEREGRSVALKAQEEGLEAIRNLLHQAGPYITKVLIRQVSENARQIFGEIMQDYARHLTWHEDYGVTLEVDGHERQFAQLSGGEQMSAALAVRLALLRELSNIDVAFFDEPTANLDGLRRESLARQILQVKGFRQLFVISHDDTFEQATQNVIRVERVGGTSRIEYG